jgi:hypothetical protein
MKLIDEKLKLNAPETGPSFGRDPHFKWEGTLFQSRIAWQCNAVLRNRNYLLRFRLRILVNLRFRFRI